MPCRVGLTKLQQLLQDVLNGKATMDTLALIEKTAKNIVLVGCIYGAFRHGWAGSRP